MDAVPGEQVFEPERLGLVSILRVVAKQLEVAADDGDRGAQLVTGVADEVRVGWRTDLGALPVTEHRCDVDADGLAIGGQGDSDVVDLPSGVATCSRALVVRSALRASVTEQLSHRSADVAQRPRCGHVATGRSRPVWNKEEDSGSARIG